MCGIVGIWNKNKEPVSSQLLTRMRDIMCSRGPDDAGIWIGENVGFGHRRLSIIDLSNLGHQPMIDETTGMVIIHNGEVYNYREIREELKMAGFIFKSHTDTEVILKAYVKWGRSCVDKFVGMFSFAIWDPKLKGIFIARDRMGIKPLYYYNDDEIFLFASRLAPLIAHPMCPKDIDNESLELYFEAGFVPSPWSILKGIKKLRPGHTLWIDEKGIEDYCYWSSDKIDTNKDFENIPENQLIDRLDNLLHESIRIHLISDVPLGIFLSGGIDSSVVAAIACQHSKTTPKTFSIGFEEKMYDESRYAKNIAQHLKTEHYEKIMKSSDLLTLLNNYTQNYDEPFADPSGLPTMMVSNFAKQHVKVCLSGDGGDELFAGYKDYVMWKYFNPLFKIPYNLRYLLGNFLSKITNRRFSVIGKSLTKDDILESFIYIRSIAREYKSNLLLNKTRFNLEKILRERIDSLPYGLDQISKFCRLDAGYFLSDGMLQKVDVASMSVGLESRVPILDHRIIEFSQSLPMKYKIRGLTGKWLLKKVLSRYIPKNLYERPKWGFAVPINKWFRKELKDMIQDELSPIRLKQFGYLNTENIQQLVNLHMLNKSDTHQILWAILTLIRWNERYRKL